MKNFAASAVLIILFVFSVAAQRSDADLRRVIEADGADAKATLPAAEHLTRAEVYSSNRLFPEARKHWKIVFDSYPDDAGVPKALFGTARSYMWERNYDKAVEWFDRLIKDFPGTKDGREGLAFKGASLVRMGKDLEAAKVYEQYVVMYPQGERIESAHLNIIDALREAGRFDEADSWVERTVTRFGGKPAEVNARHARLRMEIFRGRWAEAVKAADELIAERSFAGSMTSMDEVKYLKALALDKLGQKTEADAAFASLASSQSYFGGLALDRISSRSKVSKTVLGAGRRYDEYPVLFQSELLRHASSRKVDPRFVLAIMKQESSFRPGAKSPAGARGLLQLVFDTAIKYKDKTGFSGLQPDDLYKPEVNIALGCEYISQLKGEFGGLYEPIAASYNGGEDNAARWMERSDPKDPGVFAAEVGFSETKAYVFKVMNNYRMYRELYNEDLTRK